MAAAFSISPTVDLIDVPRRIALTGLPAGAEVTIAAETPRDGHLWRAQAVFKVGADGSIDLERDAPLRGDYAGVAAMGLVWAQTGQGELFPADLSRPLETTLTAHVGGEPIASGCFSQTLMADGVTRHPLAEDGLVGTLFLPAGEGPYPAIMILNGSGGGINEPRAALWASRGVAALALGYFGAPGLPKYISNTPLEYFARGLDWLRARVRPKNDFVAVAGQSRGGELALLLGATFPDKVSGVLGYVPSAFVHGGQAAADPAPGLGRDGPCWTLDGKPLVHQWQDNASASWKPYDEATEMRRNADAMRTALSDPAAMARARIPVERIAGPVLLLSGGDDGAWPSDLYSLIVQSSLLAAGHSHEVLWKNWPAAGHSILFPHVPATRIAHRHPVSGIATTMGGTPAANAAANAGAWEAALAFLRRHGGQAG
ncbi:acyl-CoA thioester hydrolase/BAAT C-terminal domain-containing protein [Bosea robiniae]|uniref:Acyl-CoA thioester hydrolase/BAAT N-terminal region n=1 Tax=Bosea robiniae TaxID=1036780 RepID=A0ABY0PDJ9_9HYPH|nr:acyl-CoA thioesterase/bile acid-CoA:amino acid N-acyltransferase family protein [Bosea robiniae]SDH61461.1 Acyl-CoA thioester hydrolase/BAAT N-terminal region [Bosea robiniae]